ncbi:mechanosensitive ion channel family protein [Demequina mangrovi]|uniref:Small conductance mechanosensitive channel n=1 Tax=Demequina mangrovi TaxID=1043493 RepID=A0A1H7AQV1_9MICO|nr:mechanosensitive ion channel family protein [Demequina mangrovi]SEJ68021.1 small conductance mechanosensitive channel [Demequina mangrovi]
MLSVSTEPSPSPTLEGPASEVQNLWEDLTSDTSGQFIGLGLAILLLIIVWFVGRAVIRGITLGIERGAPLSDSRTRRALKKAKIPIADPPTMELRLEAERRRQRANTIGRVLNSTLAVVLITVGVTTVMSMIGVPIGPLMASAGVVGVALGFGAQSLVKDVLSGVFMLLEDQYGVGDVVNLGEATGSVEEVGLRCTRLRSLDGTVWYVPNGEITRVGNMTRMWSRALIEVRFAYDTDVEAARQAMIDAVQSARDGHRKVASAILGDAEVAGVESLEYNAVMLRLLVQVNPATQWDVQREVRLEMRRIFAERGIELAVPGEAMVVDTDRGKRSLHDSPRTEHDQPVDEHGRPLPPRNDPDGDDE